MVSIIEITVYTLDGFILDLRVSIANMDLYVCDYEIIIDLPLITLILGLIDSTDRNIVPCYCAVLLKCRDS